MNEQAFDKYFAMLEQRFGVVDKALPVTTCFGPSYRDGIVGWQFEPEVVQDYNSKGRLLTMDLDIPCPCDLNCSYCFAKEDAYYRPQEGDKPLMLGRIGGLLLEAKQMGLRSAKIIGFGEPFRNKAIFDFIDFASEHGINLVIFTAAHPLGELRAGSLRWALNFLSEHKVSLMVKYHTLDHAQESLIVGREDYAWKRDRVLRALIDHGGFNTNTPTRLGIENVIVSEDIEELAAIYAYFKIFCNVHTDIDYPIPVGRTRTREQCTALGMDTDKLLELYRAIGTLNRRYDLPCHGFSPFIGNSPCTQLPNGIYLTLSGKIMSCCGGDEQYGDVNMEDSIWTAFERNPYRFSAETTHDCPYRQKAGLFTVEFRRAVGEIE